MGSDLSDWSNLPRDLYVTSARRTDEIGVTVEMCNVPMVLAPEVRYVRSDLAEREAERLREALRWRPMSEMPPEGCDALIWDGVSMYNALPVLDDGRWWFQYGPFAEDVTEIAPLAWMPLPPPPAHKEGEG